MVSNDTSVSTAREKPGKRFLKGFGKLLLATVSAAMCVALLAGMVYMIIRPYKEATKLTAEVKVTK